MEVALEGLQNLQKMKLDGLPTASRWVAQAVGGGVANILTKSATASRSSTAFPWPSRPGRPMVEGEGSGVVVDPDGFIVTNEHVVRDAAQIEVVLSDGRRLAARVVGSDKPSDIAVLKVAAGGLPALPWGDSDELETGDPVWAVGSPYGLDGTVTFGIISAKHRPEMQQQFRDFLQTDAAVNQGNSGGPLVNIRGEVVGINTAIYGDSFQGISFAIPSRLAREVYEKIKSTGRVPRAWLGVEMQRLNEQLAEQFRLESTEGILVSDVVGDSPADLAGLQAGDVIVAWNGEEVTDPNHFSRAVASSPVGQSARISVLRDGQTLTLKVVPEDRPPEEQLRVDR
jgi:S1-C subfamily serine protease